ncbi:hypothetical protein [Paradesulfitobacterium aromaticivorans]
MLLGAVLPGDLLLLLLPAGFCLGVSVELLLGASAGVVFCESLGVVPEGLVWFVFAGSEEAGALDCWPHPDKIKIKIKLADSKVIKLLLSHNLVMSKSSLRLFMNRYGNRTPKESCGFQRSMQLRSFMLTYH